MQPMLVYKIDGQRVLCARWEFSRWSDSHCAADIFVHPDLTPEKQIRSAGWVGRIFPSDHPVAQLLPLENAPWA